MHKTKVYENTKFQKDVIENAYLTFLKLSQVDDFIGTSYQTKKENESSDYDSFEELLANYDEAEHYKIHVEDLRHGAKASLRIIGTNSQVRFEIVLPSKVDVDEFFASLDEKIPKSEVGKFLASLEKKVPDAVSLEARLHTVQVKKLANNVIKIFVGHGHDTQWRDLKDHLHELHGFEVIAYEVGPRAGLSVKEVLEKMLDESSIAFLVLTGEDIAADSEVRARENVIHEVGLFQGRLGFKRAIVLLEKNVHEFSNILGVNQIRFSKGNIKEVYGDVLATIRREFA